MIIDFRISFHSPQLERLIMTIDELQEIADSLTAVVVKVQAATDSVNAQDAETDAAAAAVAP